MKLTIMENATDSLKRAIAYYSEKSSSGLKAAIKELISCIELFIKEKIRLLDLYPEDPVLIFAKLKITVDKSQKAYHITPLSRKQTVTFPDALKRLEWLGEPISQPDQELLKKLKVIRNELEHLNIDQDSTTMKNLFATTLGFTVKFVEKYLSIALHTLVDPNTWKSIVIEPTIHGEIEKIYRELCEGVFNGEDRLAGATTCIHCGTDLIVAAKGYYSGIKCKVCGYTQAFEMCYSCKKDYSLDDLEPSEGDTYLCKKCHKEIYG